MPPDSQKIPIVVLSGFLGSGKTTLLNALLRHPSFESTAVIVNELGDIGIDDLLVASAEENVVLLKSGCLCCSLLNTLRETLLDLFARRRTGALPPFRRVVVETTGLADPAPILQSLLRDRMLTRDFAFDELVVVVDGVFGVRELDEHREARQQAALADRLVISKLDLADAAAAAALSERLRSLNPLAPIVEGRGGGTTAEDVFGPAGKGSAERRMPFAVKTGGPEPSHAHAHHRHDAEVRADSFFIKRSIAWSGVGGWTEAAGEFFGPALLRCKGLLAVTGASGPVLLQGVQGVFAPPEVLARWPSCDRRSRLVCITRALEPALLRASLSILHIEAGAFRPATVGEMLVLHDEEGTA